MCKFRLSSECMIFELSIQMLWSNGSTGHAPVPPSMSFASSSLFLSFPFSLFVSHSPTPPLFSPSLSLSCSFTLLLGRQIGKWVSWMTL